MRKELMMNKFKKGDKVRVINTSKLHPDIKRNDEGVVIEPHDKAFTYMHIVEVEFKLHTQWVEQDNIELIKVKWFRRVLRYVLIKIQRNSDE